MRNQMFKVAGVKNEKDFYKKFPTEEAFMAKHGKTFKAQWGAALSAVGGMAGIAGNSGKNAQGFLGNIGGVAGGMSSIGEIGQGLSAIKAGKEARIGAEQTEAVSNISLQAAMTPDADKRRHDSEIIQNRYDNLMRPVNGEEFFPIDGVGTNVLAKEGANIEKAQEGWKGINFGQQLDGAYSSVSTPNQIGQKPGGFNNFMSGYGGAQLGQLAGNAMGNDGGSQLGGAIGGLAGSAFGPVGSAVGKMAGKLIGGAIDTNDVRQKRAEGRTMSNMGKMAGMDFGNNVQSQYKNVLQHGGTIPGDEDIQPLWGGDIQPTSENPFSEGGNTMEFQGNSHKKGGIGVNYAGNNIEAEGGEPAFKMKDDDGTENLVILGDLPISKQTSELMGDPKAKGKKFKAYGKEISKNENKANKKRTDAIVRASNLGEKYKFDRIGLDTQSIISKGSDAKLKTYAEQKENAAYAQSAINDTAEEMGIKAVTVAKGGDRMKSNLKKINQNQSMYAQQGVTASSDDYPIVTGTQGTGKQGGAARGSFDSQHQDPVTGLYGGHTAQDLDKYKTQHPWYNWNNFNPKDPNSVSDFQIEWNKRTKGNAMTVDGKMGNQTLSAVENSPVNASNDAKMSYNVSAPLTSMRNPAKLTPIEPENVEIQENQKKGWNFNPAGLSSMFGRGTDAEGLDGNQLWGEMYAMSNNQVDPVYAQSYKPELDVPYDISLQDQLNRNTSTFRGAQRMAGGNPAATAMLAAQQYGADQPILADQFRMNQGKKDQVYSGNRATMNDAMLRNNATYDQQFIRQSQAKSNTKETAQAAINSISDKYAKNKLEQRTLKTYENMYNYRFGDNHVAYNVNDAANFEAMQQSGKANGAAQAYQDMLMRKQTEKENSKLPPAATPGINSMAKYGTIARTLKKL